MRKSRFTETHSNRQTLRRLVQNNIDSRFSEWPSTNLFEPDGQIRQSLPHSPMQDIHTPIFKAIVAVAAVQVECPLDELAIRFDVHSSEIAQWERQLRAKMDEIFD